MLTCIENISPPLLGFTSNCFTFFGNVSNPSNTPANFSAVGTSAVYLDFFVYGGVKTENGVKTDFPELIIGAGTGTFVATLNGVIQSTTPQPWGTPTQIAVNPDNASEITVTTLSAVYYSSNFGASFTNVIGNLGNIFSYMTEGPQPFGTAIIPISPSSLVPSTSVANTSAIVVGTRGGVAVMFGSKPGAWVRASAPVEDFPTAVIIRCETAREGGEGGLR